jgi:hypothetical protein
MLFLVRPEIEIRKSKLENPEEQKPFFRQPTDKVAKGAKKTKGVLIVNLCGLVRRLTDEFVYFAPQNRSAKIETRKSKLENRGRTKAFLPSADGQSREGRKENQASVNCRPLRLGAFA